MQSDWMNNDNDWQLKKLQHDSLKTSEKVVEAMRETIEKEVLAQSKDYERLFGSHSAQFAEYLTMVAQKLEQHGVQHSDVINWLTAAAREGSVPADYAYDLRDSQSKTVPFIPGGPMQDFVEQSLLDKSLGNQGAASPRPVSPLAQAAGHISQAVTSPYPVYGDANSVGNGNGNGNGSHGNNGNGGHPTHSTPAQPVSMPPHTPVSMPLHPYAPAQPPMPQPAMPMTQAPMPVAQGAMSMPQAAMSASASPQQMGMPMAMPPHQPPQQYLHSQPQPQPQSQPQSMLPPHAPLPGNQPFPQPNFNHPSPFGQPPPQPAPQPQPPQPQSQSQPPQQSSAIANPFAAQRRPEDKKDDDKYVFDPFKAWD